MDNTNPFDKFDSANPFDKFDTSDDSTLHKAGKLLDKAFHSAMGGMGPTSEAASNFVSGIPAALGGGLTYLGTLGATHDPDAALAVKQGVEGTINKGQYESHSTLGKGTQDAINTAFKKIIEGGGPAFENTVKSIPFIGKDLSSDHEAMDTMGKAFTEMALNVAPVEGLIGMRGKGGLDHMEKPKLVDPKNPFNQFDESNKQNGAIDAGIPPSKTNPQGQLFSDPTAPTQPIPENAQMGLFDKPVTIENGIPYEPLSLADEGALPSQRPADLQMPMVPDRLELVPKDQAPMSEEPFQIPNIGSRDAARAKAEDITAEQAAMQEAATKKQAEIDAAHGEQEKAKQADYAKMEAQRELDHMNMAASVEQTPGRNFFTDPTNRDKLDFHSDHDFAHEALGDKSLMDHASTGELVNHLAKGDVHSALDVISQNHENVGYRNLANYLKDKLEGIKVVLHDDGVLQMGDRQATGYYDPTTRTVGLSKVGAVSPHTVLHELIHAVTSDFINNRPNDLRVLGLKDLYNKLNDLGMAREFPGITNVKEFVAEAHSNPAFQDFLKDHRINTKSAWQRFVDNVKSILGVSDPKVTTALDHAMDLSKQVIEAKDAPAAMEQFKAAGVPSKLADLMVTRQPEKPNAVVSNENMKAVKLANFGAKFDFTPLKPEEIIPMAREAKDIPASTLETIKANIDAGGRFASLRHNNNPVVKYTFAYVDHAVKNYERWIRENVTDKVTGVKSMLQNLPSDDFTAVHQQLMLDEGQVERTPQQMRALGWNEKMVEAAQRLRQVDRESLARVNEARAKMNPPLLPIEPRMGHLAGRFLGDFYHTVYELKPDGTRSKAVMMLTDHTSWGAQKLADYFAGEHPEWEVSKQEYNSIKKTQNSDRFSGFMELMNFISKKDPEVAKALNSLDKYNRRAATNYLNTLRHAKEKKVQPGGIIGSEGHKSWLDAKTNAEEGFKGHLAYLDTTTKWVEMQKAMENISKVITDKEVTKAQPNAIKWSTAYTDHALHRNQGFLTDMAQSLLSETGRVTGVGHTNITKGVNWMSSAIMRNWMGIGNIPFAAKHMLLPLQKMPAMMTYLMTHGGVDAHTMGMASLKSLSSYYHYLKREPTTPFENLAFNYAKDNNIFSVTLDNLSGAIQSSKTRRFLGKVADADFSGPEHAIRGTSFFFYAHALHDAGMHVGSALSAAEHLSKFLYTDYAPHEAPRAAAKAGWIGQLAFQITRYKANEIGELGFFNRERATAADHEFMGKLTGNLPMMVHIGSLLAFTGATGMLGYKEMDEAYSLFRKYVMGSPDNLTALLQRSKAPELIKYGLSSLLGIDSKISEAELLPAPFPTTAAEINIIGTAAKAAWFHDEFHTKQLALAMTPSTVRGPLENKMFTQPQETAGPHSGESLYLNPNTGEGRVWRTPEQQSIRNLGFHTTAETEETENNFAQQRIMNDHRDIADHILDRAKGLMASNALTPQAAQELGKQYAAHQQSGQPDFASALTTYAVGRKTSQREQMELKASRDRMGNSLGIMQRNK